MRRVFVAGLVATTAVVPACTGAGAQSPTRSPYRHVGDDPPPASARVSEPLGEVTRRALTLSTDDRQATLIVNAGTIPRRKGQRTVEARIVPVDPSELGRPPEGFAFDGNAYRLALRYLPSRDPVVLAGDATVALGVATRADAIYRSSPPGWAHLPGAASGGTLIGRSRVLGTFVAMRSDATPSPSPSTDAGDGRAVPPVVWAAGLVLLAWLAIVVVRRRRA